MTLKTRNRINILLFILTLVLLLIFLAMIFYSIINKNYFPPAFIEHKGRSFFLFRYSPHCVLAALLFELIYILASTLIIHRSFQKTQASEVIYLTLFLFAMLFDTSRIIIILFNITKTYSSLLIACGNFTLFSRVLYPIALLFTVILSNPEQRPNIERNIFLTLLGAVFLTQFIPLNSAIMNDNFTVNFAYRRILIFVGIFSILIALIALFAKNRQHFTNQITTLGFAMIGGGTAVLFVASSVFFLMISIFLLCMGTFLFLHELHKQYLLF